MGKSRFLPRSVIGNAIALLLLFAVACGGDKSLLAKADLEEIYSAGGGGASSYVSSKNAADFGKVTGTVTYEGRRRSKRLGLYKDFCINANPNGLMSEDFLVGAKGELAGVIVYIKRGLKKVTYPVPTERLLLDQKSCRYVPHIAVLRVGQPLVIRNSDNHEHNVHWMPGVNGEMNKPMNSAFDLDPLTFSKTQIASAIKCDIHGWMESYVAVLPHPCWAITKADGTFEISEVPPGSLKLAAWHEALGELEVQITTAKNGTLVHEFKFPGK